MRRAGGPSGSDACVGQRAALWTSSQPAAGYHSGHRRSAQQRPLAHPKRDSALSGLPPDGPSAAIRWHRSGHRRSARQRPLAHAKVAPALGGLPTGGPSPANGQYSSPRAPSRPHLLGSKTNSVPSELPPDVSAAVSRLTSTRLPQPSCQRPLVPRKPTWDPADFRPMDPRPPRNRPGAPTGAQQPPGRWTSRSPAKRPSLQPPQILPCAPCGTPAGRLGAQRDSPPVNLPYPAKRPVRQPPQNPPAPTQKPTRRPADSQPTGRTTHRTPGRRPPHPHMISWPAGSTRSARPAAPGSPAAFRVRGPARCGPGPVGRRPSRPAAAPGPARTGRPWCPAGRR